jgi:hypothetical protein
MILVQEQAIFRILHHPRQSFLQVLARDRRTWEDVPFVCVIVVQS